MEQELRKRAAVAPAPEDGVYANNVRQPHRPVRRGAATRGRGAARLARQAGKTIRVERVGRDFEPARLRTGRTLFAVVQADSAVREGHAGLPRLLEAAGCLVVLVK